MMATEESAKSDVVRGDIHVNVTIMEEFEQAGIPSFLQMALLNLKKMLLGSPAVKN